VGGWEGGSDNGGGGRGGCCSGGGGGGGGGQLEVTAAVIVVVAVVKKKRPSECDARSSTATRTVDAYHRCSKSKIKQKKELAVTECESRSSPVVH